MRTDAQIDMTKLIVTFFAILQMCPKFDEHFNKKLKYQILYHKGGAN